MDYYLNDYLAPIEREEEKRKFEKLHTEYKRQLYSMAVALIREPYLAEDVLQEMFAYVAKHMDKIDETVSKRTFAFLSTITMHKAYDCLRKERVRQKRNADFKEIEDVVAIDFTKYIGDSDIITALRKVPEQQRSALILRYVYQLSAKEIAEEMNCSVSKAEKLVSRGKILLRKLYIEMKHQ